MKIVIIVGARPQFIKAAALNRVIEHHYPHIEQLLIHTGQHYDLNMSEVFFEEMDIPKPHYNLGIANLDRLAMLREMEAGIADLLRSIEPDLVLVFGDTNSTLAGARAARKFQVPLAHVEAGLRSFNDEMPEELNRVETDQLSDFLFVPSINAENNLKKEEISGTRIFNVGDIMYDSIRFYAQKADTKSNFKHELQDPYVLLTLHRQENTDDHRTLTSLLDSIDHIAAETRVLFPCHPRTRKVMQELGLTSKAEIVEPVGYFDMIQLIRHSVLVMTDSGGLQKEAYYLGKFCITLRQETEWTELVDLGVNKVCGSDDSMICCAVFPLP